MREVVRRTVQPELSVVVPAYKKQFVVAEALRGIQATLSDAGINHEIIVVIDGSPDDTEATVRGSGVTSLRIISYPENRGKGFAIRTGLASVRAPLVAFADADVDLHPSDLVNLQRLLLVSGADGIVGSKFHADSRIHYPIGRRLQSATYRQITRALFGLKISDTQTGLKVFKSDPVKAAAEKTRVDGFAFDLELLVQLHDQGCILVDGPVTLEYSFSSTVPIGAAVSVLADTLKLAQRRKSGQDRLA